MKRRDDWDNLGVLDGLLKLAFLCWQLLRLAVPLIVGAAIVVWALRILGVAS